jgi:hypothetical protein
MRLGTETGSLVNHFLSASIAKIPSVGDGATICHWSDRTPGTVLSVERKGKSVIVTVQTDTATRVDTNGESEAQEYRYERDENGARYMFRSLDEGKSFHAVGRNFETGRLVKSDSTGIFFGRREKFHDYSF